MEDLPKTPREIIAENIREVDDLPTLLGVALLTAQGVEFGLYGIASHLSHTEVGQKDKRFRKLNPETFLRGDISELKVTLGQLVNLWGDLLMIKSSRLTKFCEDRNLIVHNYRRVYMMNIKGNPSKKDGIKFLQDFVVESTEISQILLGLTHLMTRAAAIKEGREEEIKFGDKEEANINAYRTHAVKYKLVNSSLEELVEFFTVNPT